MKIAVWNTAFLGDSILTLPLIRVIKAAYPDSDLDFYVRKGLESLYCDQPEINRVFPCDKKGKYKGIFSLFRQGREISSRKYDIWVNAHLSLRSSLMALASHAPTRVGYAESVLSSAILTKRISRQFGKLHEIDRLLLLAKALDIPSPILNNEALHWPELCLPKTAVVAADNIFSSLPHSKTIGIHPGSVWQTKRWTPEGFAFILRNALSQGMNCILFAGNGELAESDQVKKLAEVNGTENGFLDLSGKLSLTELAAVIAKLNVYVTNDSGPMHLAWAQHIPTTAIFGPTVEKLGFFPRGENSSVMEIDLPCRPCGKHGHKQCPQHHFRCMKDIPPSVVWDDILKKLA